MVSDCVLHQRRVTFDLERFHNAIFVKGNSPGGELEHAGYLFHAFPCRQQLQDLPWPFCSSLPLVEQLFVLTQ